MTEHPEIAEYEWIDDCFRVWETRLWSCGQVKPNKVVK